MKAGVATATALNKFCAPAKHYLAVMSSSFSKQLSQVSKGSKDPWSAAAFVNRVNWLTTSNSDSLQTRMSQMASAALAKLSATTPTDAQVSAYQSAAISHCKINGLSATTQSRATRLDTASGDIRTMAGNVPWYPKGYSEFSDGLAYRWLHSGEYHCADYSYNGCFGVSVVTRDGCPNSLYVELTTYDGAGNAVGFTNDTTGALSPGDRAKLIPEIIDSGVSTAQMSKISCY